MSGGSKIIRKFVIAIIILILGLIALFVLGGREQSIEGFADVIIPFGQYESIRMLDAEDEILAVKEPGGFLKLMDYDGNQLVDLKPYTAVGIQQGDCISLESADGWTVADFRELLEGKRPEAANYDLVKIDRSGRYFVGAFIGGEGVDTYIESSVVSTLDGGILFEGEEFIELTGHEGLVVDRRGEKNDRIINLETGETVRELESNQNIADSGEGFWVIRNSYKNLGAGNLFVPDYGFYSYVADENFEPVFGKKIFDDITCYSGKYFLGEYLTEVELGASGPELWAAGEVEHVIMDMEGNVIYKSGLQERNAYRNGNVQHKGISGDILFELEYATRNAMWYVDLEKYASGEADYKYKIGKGEDTFSMVDFGDGIAVINRPVDNMLMNLDRYDNDSADWMDKFEWSFVNINLEPVCGYIFDGAYPSKNGFAVVKMNDSWGLIKFHDAL
ncbi:MAG: hypothetical protein IJN72_09110 [Firmicutes bacterium]|nr:hypothetical protein [Bacillota bacterium]